jgi:hypothetical protein
LEKESRERTQDSNGRVTELDDDAMLPPPGAGAGTTRNVGEPRHVNDLPSQDTRAQTVPSSSYAKEAVA